MSMMQVALTQLVQGNVESVVAIYEDRHNLITIGPGTQLFLQPIAVRRVKVSMCSLARRAASLC